MTETILLTFATFILRAFIPLFFGVFLLFYRKRSKQNFPLSCIFLIIGALYFYNSFVRFPSVGVVDVYNVRSFLILVFIAPFTNFYAQVIFNKKTSLTTKLLHFIPFVAMTLLWFVLQDCVQPSIPPCYNINEIVGYFSVHPLYVAYFLLLMTVFFAQVCTYFSIAWIWVQRVRKIHRENGVSMKTTTRLLIVDGLFWYYPSVALLFMSYSNNITLAIIHNISIAISVTALAILSMDLRLPLKTVFLPKNDSILKPKTNLSDQDSVTDSRLLKQIQQLFENERIYRDSEVTLDDVVKRCTSNRTYVSKCINRHYDCTFKQLLTRYRLLDAMNLLASSDLDVQQIITDVGFNSRSTFYNAFEEQVGNGISPLEWREQVLKKS
jgi:AraC-like DNA-binding protein